MKPQQIIIMMFLLLFSLSFLSSCGSGGESVLDYNFKQGIAELNIKLFENAPPPEIYPDSEFKFIVELDNQAAYDATDGTVRIVGLDPKYFIVSPAEQSFNSLLGRSLAVPSGEKSLDVQFAGHSQRLFEGAESYSQNYFLITKYNSQMDFTDTVCINPSLYRTYNPGCEMEGRKSYDGQGAPVAVTQMEELVTPGSGAAVEFRFQIRNEGSGQVGHLNLNDARLGNELLFCKFIGSKDPKSVVIGLNDPEVLLVCKKPLRELNAFTTAVSLSFSFDYEVQQEMQLTISANPNQGLFS